MARSGGSDEGPPGGVAPLLGDPRAAGDRTQDVLLEGPEVLAQEVVAEPDGVAGAAGAFANSCHLSYGTFR